MPAKRIVAIWCLLLVLFSLPGLAFAQDISLEWTRWDAQITVGQNDQLQIGETQEIAVNGGTVSRGARIWTNPVAIQGVFILLGEGSTPEQLTESNSGQPGTYSLATSGGNTTLTYYLNTPQRSGRSFIVKINYTADSKTPGMVDWRIVPGEHAFPVRSSKVTIRFPRGQTPDSSLVRISKGSGTTTVNGDTVTIQSQGDIAANEMFSVQIPYGAGVGAASNSGSGSGSSSGGSSGGSTSNPSGGTASNPGDGTVNLPGGMGLIVLIAVVIIFSIVSRGSLLKVLLNLFLGGGLKRLGGSSSRTSNPFSDSRPSNSSSSSSNQPSSSERGLRRSSSQDRKVGPTGDDKDSGGGANFG
jgi:hypothetical protein